MGGRARMHDTLSPVTRDTIRRLIELLLVCVLHRFGKINLEILISEVHRQVFLSPMELIAIPDLEIRYREGTAVLHAVVIHY